MSPPCIGMAGRADPEARGASRRMAGALGHARRSGTISISARSTLRCGATDGLRSSYFVDLERRSEVSPAQPKQ
eukprot:1097630-Pyramimonas_sp.AAC.1